MSSNGKKDYRFDNTVLDSMQEPLTVRVEKIRGTASIPIDLPPQGPDLATGQGWDKDGIRNLERWLVTEWSGGGFYHVTVSDTTSRKMEWRFLFDTREFPERTPPTMLGGLSSPNPIPLPPRQQQVSNPSNNGPSNTPWVAPQQHQQPQPQSYGPPMMVAPPTPSWGPYWQNGASGGYPGNGFNPFMPGNFNGQSQNGQNPNNQNNQNQNGGTRVFSRDEEAGYRRRRFSEDEDEQHKTERRQLEQRTRELEASLQRAELERKEADYKAQLEKAQAEAQRQIDLQRAESEKQAVALREELRKLAELSQRPKTDPEEDRVKEAIRKEEDRIDRERLRLENERREEKLRMEAERAKMDQERRDEVLRVEADRAKLEQTRRDEQLRNENERRFNELQLLITKVTEASSKPSGPDPAIIAMQESQKALQEELRRERERAEADRREREREERARADREAIKEDIRRREEDAKRREDMLMAQLNEIKSTANKGPDPVLAMMQESMRMQVESMKDVARAQQSAAEKAQSMSLSPRDLISLMNDKSSGIDQLTKNVVGVYNDMFQTQRQMIEMAAQLTGGGESTTSRLIETGLSRASEAFDRYMRTKRDETVSNAKAAEAQAQAQSQAFAIQQQRLAQMARAEASQAPQGLNGPPTFPQQAPPSLTQQVPAPVAAQQAPIPQAPKPQTQSTQPTAPKPKKDPITAAGPTQPGAKVIPLRRLGKTDEQWFGPALLERINQLRASVKDYFDSISSEPARLDEKGEIVGIDPEGVVDVLSQAVNIVLANNMHVPAVSELFLEKRYADLMDILIPDATQPYKDDCVALLMQLEVEDGDPQVTLEEEEDDQEEANE